MEALKYPIGHYTKPDIFTPQILSEYIAVISRFPQKLKLETEQLSDAQLDTPYRPDGWTIRQVVNHCADSHINALIRHKLALTEDAPTITPYAEALWAELPDCKHMPIQPALSTLQGIHARWVVVLKNLSDSQWQRTFIHPEKGKTFSLKESAGMYAWHCEHHLAHITELKKRKGWK
jgi:hypothetical protein